MNGVRKSRHGLLLAVDSAANYLLGLPLLIAPRRSAQLLALPSDGPGFYPRVLGGVLTGVATALAMERARSDDSSPAGLGVAGAIAINTLGGGAVAVWLSTPAAAELPLKGRALLWGVASAVLAIGAIEAREIRR
jgi:hypothetical protein